MGGADLTDIVLTAEEYEIVSECSKTRFEYCDVPSYILLFIILT
jgi:hypothetical protein